MEHPKTLPPFGAPSWREPVDSVGDLPTTGNTDGDVIVTKDTGIQYVWLTGAWHATAGGGYDGDDQIWMYGTSSNGSVDNAVALFPNTFRSAGSAISVDTTPEFGTRFTINQKGVYSMVYQGNFNAANNTYAITKNAVGFVLALTGLYYTPLGEALIMGIGRPDTGSISVVDKLQAGDVIRAQTNQLTHGDGYDTYNFFWIKRIA